uniref:Filamin C n=1 Tax=Cairina moschata TaxID=8855 RepID=A0A8C3CDT9_CAIMO
VALGPLSVPKMWNCVLGVSPSCHTGSPGCPLEVPKVTVLFAGQNIDKSPFGVNVGMALGDASKVTARGPGLEPVGNVANKATYFDIYTAGAGAGDVGVVIVDPQGRRDTVEVMLEDKGDSTFRCTYRPALQGPHLVHVTYAGAQIPRSPFTVNVAEGESGPPTWPRHLHRWPPVAPRWPHGGPTEQEEGAGLVMGCGVHGIWGASHKHQGARALWVFIWGAWGAGSKARRWFGYGVRGAWGTGCQAHQGASGCQARMWGAWRASREERVPPGGGGSTPRGAPRHPADGDTPQVNVGEGSHPGRVRVHGPGVEKTGLKAGEPTYFTVDCSEAGQGDVSIGIKCAPGVVGPLEADIDFDIIKNDNDTFTVKYTPPGAGLYTIMVLFANQEIPSSPFRIKVDPCHDSSKVKAEGPGLSRTGVEVGKPTHFTVHTKGAGKAKLDVQFAGPGKGPAVRDFEVIDNHDYSYTVKYTALQQGNMTVVVTYGGDPVPKSPFSVNVAPALQLSKVKVQGLSTKVAVGQEQAFAVETQGAGGQGRLDVRISSPSRRPVPCKVEPGAAGGPHRVQYVPPEEGPYKVDVTYDGHPVPGSPFTVEAVLPPDPSKVSAYGPGLQGGLVGTPAPFTIDTKGAGTGGLGLTVEGPCEAKIECQDNGDGSCSVSYLPTEPGEYAINILFAERHIPGSPFKADVRPVFDPSKVTASGPGLERGKAGEAATFLVDCSKAGDAELTIEIISDSGVKAEVLIQNNRDGTYAITYTPACPGSYTITIKYGGHPVPKFPVRVTVDPAIDTSGVKVYGKGVEPRGVLREVSTDFTVDARALTKTGGPHVKARVLNPSGAKTETYVTDHGDGTYRVDYTPYEDGVHHVEVTYKDVAVPLSPFRVAVAEGCEPTRVRAHGPGLEGGLVGTANCFTVETRGAGTGGLGLAIEGPSEAKMSCKDNKDGSCTVEYIPFTPGDYDVNITFGGHPIPGSPFRVPVQDVVDPSKVKCSGPGLGPSVRARLPQTFTVDCSAAGLAPLEVTLLGPTGLAEPVEVRDNGDGTHKVTYTPATDGPYTVAVKYADQEVPRSPFKIKVLPAHDASKVRASGPGLSASGIPASLPVEFTIDARNAGEGLLTVQILDPEGQPKKAAIRDNGDGTYTVSYVPDLPGRYTITIKYGGDEIPCSPFRIHAVPSGDASKCLVTGGPCPTACPTILHAAPHRSLAAPLCPALPHGIPALPHATSLLPHGFSVLPHSTPRLPHSIPTLPHCALCCPIASPRCPTAPPRCPTSFPCCPTAPCAAPQHPHPAPQHPHPGPSKAEITCKDNKDGTCTVSYLPTAPGDYNIIVRFDDKHIPGSPFTAKITGDDSMRTSQLNVGTSTDVSLKITETDLSLLTASIRAPSGNEEPCLLKRLPNRHIGISFTPKEVGEHVVSVKKSGQHVTNSPFKILVGQSEIGDASRVKVWGKGLVEGHTFEVAEFIVDTRSAGYGGLGLSIEGPSKVDINCEDVEDGTCKVTYCPTEPGNYIINIKFADKHVPGSPFTVKVTGEGRMKESITRRRQAPSIATIGSTCDLNLKIPGNWFQMVSAQERLTRTFTRSSHTYTRTERTEISKTRGGETKREVRVEESTQVGGDPFPNVFGDFLGREGLGAFGSIARGQEGACVCRGVRASAPGLGTAAWGRCRLPGVCASPLQMGAGFLGCTQTSFKWAQAPWGACSPLAKGCSLLGCTKPPCKGETVTVNQPASFAVQLNGARGVIDAKVHTPGGVVEECYVSELDGDKYSIGFLPRENGVHSIDLRFNGRHVPGSPFNIRVGEQSQAGDPGLVTAYGPGLEGGITGVCSEFLVKTANAGAGALSVTIDGPSKVKLDCVECAEGHRVTYTPMAPGNYLISIKYGGPHHIVGSPFKAKVTGPRLSGGHSLHETSTVLVETVTRGGARGPPAFGTLPKFSSDASKVVARGPGLATAYVGQKNHFSVDCSKAGLEGGIWCWWWGPGGGDRVVVVGSGGRGIWWCCWGSGGAGGDLVLGSGGGGSGGSGGDLVVLLGIW